MKSVNIAKFKSELGAYLGFVRKGEEIIVLDRKTPLARVIPFKEKQKHLLVLKEASEDPMLLFKLKPKKATKLKKSSLEFLQEDRD